MSLITDTSYRNKLNEAIINMNDDLNLQQMSTSQQEERTP